MTVPFDANILAMFMGSSPSGKGDLFRGKGDRLLSGEAGLMNSSADSFFHMYQTELRKDPARILTGGEEGSEASQSFGGLPVSLKEAASRNGSASEVSAPKEEAALSTEAKDQFPAGTDLPSALEAIFRGSSESRSGHEGEQPYQESGKSAESFGKVFGQSPVAQGSQPSERSQVQEGIPLFKGVAGDLSTALRQVLTGITGRSAQNNSGNQSSHSSGAALRFASSQVQADPGDSGRHRSPVVMDGVKQVSLPTGGPGEDSPRPHGLTVEGVAGRVTSLPDNPARHAEAMDKGEAPAARQGMHPSPTSASSAGDVRDGIRENVAHSRELLPGSGTGADRGESRSDDRQSRSASSESPFRTSLNASSMAAREQQNPQQAAVVQGQRGEEAKTAPHLFQVREGNQARGDSSARPSDSVRVAATESGSGRERAQSVQLSGAEITRDIVQPRQSFREAIVSTTSRFDVAESSTQAGRDGLRIQVETRGDGKAGSNASADGKNPVATKEGGDRGLPSREGLPGEKPTERSFEAAFRAIETDSHDKNSSTRRTFDTSSAVRDDRTLSSANGSERPLTAADAGRSNASLVRYPLETRIIAEQLQSVASSLRDGGSQRVRIHLSPPHLGSLDMEVILRDKTVRVLIRVDSVEAGRFLQAGAEQLKSSLQGQGFTVDSLSVNQRDQWAGLNQGFGQDRLFSEEGGGSDRDNGKGDVSDESHPGEGFASGHDGDDHQGRVNYFA